MLFAVVPHLLLVISRFKMFSLKWPSSVSDL
jgi:hypothetical protein